MTEFIQIAAMMRSWFKEHNLSMPSEVVFNFYSNDQKYAMEDQIKQELSPFQFSPSNVALIGRADNFNTNGIKFKLDPRRP